ncbi:MAG: AAA family ATPase, partial [Synergistales bacterium]|nr:AAA family ATPase [Synergistales bacterium]
MSLGGIRDEAEIRGHRRTYVGALPGRIIQKIRNAGTRNPVMLLDEVDKLGVDFRGDPSAALLEVLDPEQNHQFTDHFLEVPFNLSRVLFLTTANVSHTIPKPLLDRMETLHIPGYVAEEKMHIAKEHLLHKVTLENGLSEEEISISDGVIQKIIGEYTREAGVRNLERQLAKITRKTARKLVDEQEKGQERNGPIRVTKQQLPNLLGPPKRKDTRLPEQPTRGTGVGLAWTETGGDVLVIEAVTMKGKGEITLTGNLGAIMKESAKTGLGYIKANASALGLQEEQIDNHDIHVHVPEGAIPKDGPSAGITMTIAMLSALSGKTVRPDVAMTGEISLRGNVLPVGGTREKVLAAKRYGIQRVALPADNRVDIEQFPAWIRKGVEFIYLEHISHLIELLLQVEEQAA